MKRKEVANFITSFILRCLRLLPTGILVRVKTSLELVGRLDHPNAEVLLALDSPAEYQMRLRSCAKEPETVAWIENMLRPGDVFYDIGANVGAYAILASKIHTPEIRVYAFEPGFANYAKLCKNIILNNCALVTPLPIALSDETGVTTFHYSDIAPGAALHQLSSSPSLAAGCQKQAVLSYSLDDLIETLHLPIPNCIKLDVDGIELKILNGAGRTLGHPVVRSLLVEVEEDAPLTRETVALLEKHCFALRSKHPYVFGGKESTHSKNSNYIFVRQQ